jgi:hypothetical protein
VDRFRHVAAPRERMVASATSSPADRASHVEFADAAQLTLQLDLDLELVSRHDRLLEARVVDSDVVVQESAVACSPRDRNTRMPAACAIASRISTPGMIGRCGK